MKMMQKFGMYALAWAALAVCAPWSAEAAGDIRSIDAVKSDSDPNAVCGPDYVARVGQKIRFSIRLLNTNGASQSLESVQCPWLLHCEVPGWESTAQLFPLQVGLWIGGHRAWATLEDITPLDQVFANGLDHALTDEQIPVTDRVYYTRLLFSYEVQPGDIAMPVTFCNADGTAALASGDAICFNNTYYWCVRDRFTLEEAQFVMGTTPLDKMDEDTPAGWDLTDAGNYENLGNYDLSLSGTSKQGFFVQTVDFDGTADPWRTIPAGSSDPEEGAPKIVIPGGAITNTTVYVWTTNSAVVVTDPAKSTTESIQVGCDGETPIYKDVQMLAVSIAQSDSVTFKLKAMADAEGKDTEVFLSSEKGFSWTSAGVQVKNYTSRRVLVSKAKLPGIKLSVSPASITCDANTGDVKAELLIEPTQVPSGETYTVNLDVRYDSVGGAVVESGTIGLSTDMDSPYTFKTNITFSAGQEQQTVYVFGLGFAAKDPKTIYFTPSVSGSTFFSGEMTPTQLAVKEAKPVIEECPGSIEATAKTDYSLTLKLADSYANLKGAYTVEWMQTSSSTYKTIAGTYVPNDENEITVNLKYDKEGENVTTHVRVTGPDGNQSDSVEFTATVAGAKTAVLVTNREGEDNYHTYGEGEKVTGVKVQLKNWKNETGDPLYAFLVPTNTYAETLMTGIVSQAKCFPTTPASRGVKIAAGDTLSASTDFTLLDNAEEEDPIEFAIEIRTKQAYNDASGEQVLFVSPEDVSQNYIDVTNCPPTFKTLGIVGGVQAYSDGKPTGKTITAEQGVLKTFTWTAKDVSADLPGMTSKWTVTLPTGSVDSKADKLTFVGDPATNKFTYTFALKGTYTVTVQMYDKDMDASDEDSWTSTTFYVIVADAPALGFVFPDGTAGNYHFPETCVDNDDSAFFRVGPITAAMDDILIRVRAVKLGTDESRMTLYGTGGDQSGWVTNKILAGVTLDTDTDGMYTKIELDKLDGTYASAKKGTGFRLEVECITDTKTPDGVTVYSNYYPKASAEVYVDNVAPALTASTEPAMIGTNTSVKVSANQTITVTWESTDVEADSQTNVVLKWVGVTPVYGENSSPSSTVGTATFSFSGAGSHTMSFYMVDKNKGVSETKTWTFEIDPSRDAYVIPLGPDRNGQSDLSSIYAQADGLGAGYVYADGSGNFTKAAEFWHYYSFTPSETQPTFFAQGYSVGAVDDGTLSMYDHAIDVRGANDNATTITNPYRYDDVSFSEYGKKDSFFYAWVYNSSDESGVMTGTAYPSPAYGTNQITKKTFILPNETDDNSEDDDGVTSYPKLTLEAVFSREFYAEDNLGDINADGMPDYFAKRYDLYTLVAALSGDSESESSETGGLTSGYDVRKNVSAYNGDEPGDGANSSSEDSDNTGDFLPECYDTAGSYSWAAGTPFKAITEIRGFHEGLNEPTVSDISLSSAEEAALNLAYALAVKKGITHDCADARAWMTAGYWSPETQRSGTFGSKVTVKRCDPTSQDTDADDIPDGYEYYIWYKAFIGDLDDSGTIVRLTGSRFNPATPGKGDTVPAEVVAEAFNPVEPRAAGTGTGRTATVKLLDGTTFTYNPTDFDEDGIADWIEVAVGTNPASWDTDGDGISDYWELLYGTDPCDPVDADRTAHWTKSNPDRDFMAYAKTTVTYDVVTLSDGSCWAFAEGTSLADLLEAGTEMTHKAKVGAATYYFASEPATYDDGTAVRLLYDVTGYREMTIGETVYAVIPTNFTASTVLTVEALATGGEGEGEGEGETAAITQAKWKSGAKGLPVFLYGGEDYVPACSNITKNLETAIPVAGDVLLADYVTATPLTLVHNQVYQEFGFDPRTAWTIDDFGYVGTRWHNANSTSGGNEGTSGLATNTVPYTTRDEYLLADYLHHVNGVTLTADSFQHLTVTTCPRQQYAVTNAIDEADNKTIYGADTDGDGMPDGWELYVGLDPNYLADASLATHDTDDLVPLAEYAGTDSCDAYTNRYDTLGNLIYVEVSSITQNHPGRNSGWYNKFFPTDPHDADTDADGLNDDKEGSSWKSSVPNGRAIAYNGTLTFIYGDEDELTDDGSCCIRGGGLNPCTVDTDQDLLPDPWEYEFAGYVVTKDESGVGTYIKGGMDGTWSNDAYTRLSDGLDDSGVSLLIDKRTGTIRDYDFDHDGLQNFQEYLVQAMRHFRYDDSETPLMGRLPGGKFVAFTPMQTFDGTAFFETCRKAGFNGTSAWKFREIGYFARPPKAWDRLALNVSLGSSTTAASTSATATSAASANIANYKDYEGVGWRIMLRPQGLSYEATATEEKRVKASGYCCTDPRKWDTDNDGMDDYYEIFHGLNPLYGGVSSATSVQDVRANVTDIIGSKYGQITACFNAWTGWPAMGPTIPDYDVMKYPWVIGDADCDADGDGLRNYDEALLVNITSPTPTHTDPTPLWLTDVTIANKASFTAQYYGMDPYQPVPDIVNYPWGWYANVVNGAYDGKAADSGKYYMFTFEENEGYDTDHDWKCDAVELTKTVENTTDPLLYSDPYRRQALYFPVGEKSAAVSCSGTQQRTASTSYDLLRQFTVECWVKPAKVGGTEQIILERVCSYGASTLSNNQASVMRANFRLGINAEGCVFGELEGNTVNSRSVRITSAAVCLSDVWAHYAIAYDGSTFALYKDADSVPVAKAENVGIIPANGVTVVLQEGNGEVATIDQSGVMASGYRTLPCALILGAGAKTADALDVVSAASSDASDDGLSIDIADDEDAWGAFQNFYAGYIDEVRVWDGARSAADLAADYDHRYTFDEIRKLRDETYKYWKQGYTRNDTVNGVLMPPELLQHYNFVTLPGATEATDVITAPAGFIRDVVDNVRVDGAAIPLFCGWWNALKTHSTVYRNYMLVPWIPNAVAHLPLMDGSVVDSQYWSEDFAGIATTTNVFPNTANPYPYYVYGADKAQHSARLGNTNEMPVAAQTFADLYTFQLRSDFVGTSDLLPLGGCFAKRASDFWDNGGPMDAWCATGTDADADGLPDWWEKLHELDINDAADWDTLIPYNGVMIEAWEVYQRELAKGLLPSEDTANYSSAYLASLVDVDQNGIADWWEAIYNIAGQNEAADADNDQLPNVAEYFIGERFAKVHTNGVALGEFMALNPTLMKTYGARTNAVVYTLADDQGQAHVLTNAWCNQLVPDYFLRVGSLYLGEMFTDHDFMEDWWELTNSVKYTSRSQYDALSDEDDDGWSAFAECRYALKRNFFAAELNTIALYQELIEVCRPEPTIALRATYYGLQVNDAEEGPLVVRVSTENMHVADAQFTIPYGVNPNTLSVEHEYVGRFRAGVTLTGRLQPGTIMPYSVALQEVEVRESQVRCTWTNTADVLGWAWGTVHSTTYDEYENVARLYPGMVFLVSTTDSLNWQSCKTTMKPDDSFHYGAIWLGDTEIGKVNYWTGAYSLEMDKLALASGKSLDGYLFRLNYSYQIDPYWPKTFYLNRPDVAMTGSPYPYGYVREGRNVISAFIDFNGDGEWTAGEPFGCAVADIGWWETPVEIELTDTSAQMARYDLNASLNGSSNSSGYTDRDVIGYVMPNVTATGEDATSNVVSILTRVRVVRDKINGESSDRFSNDVVLDRTFNVDLRPYLTEADLLAEGLYDLDWGTLATKWYAATGKTLANVNSATYRVVVGEGDLSAESVSTLPVSFVNVFEVGTRATTTSHSVLVGSPNGLVDAASPTFSWRHDNGVKDYPAFQLRVWAVDSGALVYDSGVRKAPLRNSLGVYSWTAPLYAGMMTPKGVVFDPQANYAWAVSMLDAKYTGFNSSEPKSTFRLNTVSDETSELTDYDHLVDYGQINVCVKYFGPGAVSTCELAKLIHVEAYTTPDFSGQPAGAAYVKDVSTLASPSNMTVNAKILGLAKEDTYYIRAYIDTDGDYERDVWESWGYANRVGTEARAVFDPTQFTVGETATVYIEDTDVENDGFPDVYEWETVGSFTGLDDTTPVSNDGAATVYARVNPYLLSALNSYYTTEISEAASQFAFAKLMSAATSSSLSSMSAANLISGGAISEITTDAAVNVVSFSMESGIVVSVDVTAADSSYFTLENVPVTWKLLYKASLVEADWSEIATGTVDVPVNAGAATIDTTAMNEAIKAKQAEGSGFFKVSVGIAR